MLCFAWEIHGCVLQDNSPHRVYIRAEKNWFTCKRDQFWTDLAVSEQKLQCVLTKLHFSVWGRKSSSRRAALV